MAFSDPIRPLEYFDTFDETKDDYYVRFSVSSLQNIKFGGYHATTITLFGKDYYVPEGCEVIGNNNGNPLVLNFANDVSTIAKHVDRYIAHGGCTFYFYINPNPGNFETASLRVFSKELYQFHDIDIPINKYDLFCPA